MYTALTGTTSNGQQVLTENTKELIKIFLSKIPHNAEFDFKYVLNKLSTYTFISASDKKSIQKDPAVRKLIEDYVGTLNRISMQDQSRQRVTATRATTPAAGAGPSRGRRREKKPY